MKKRIVLALGGNALQKNGEVTAEAQKKIANEVGAIIAELADQGKAIIMISSELPEIIGMCDRTIIMHEGNITGELERSEFSQEAIMRYAIGVEEEEVNHG